MTTYKNRYQANKNKQYGDIVVKVCGGYAVMSYFEYKIWKKQK